MSKNGSSGWGLHGGAQPQFTVKCPSCGVLTRRRRSEDGGYGLCSKSACAESSGDQPRDMRKVEPYAEARARKAKLELAGGRP